MKNHHDNRPITWSVSLSEEESRIAEKNLAKTGLTKAKYTRQLLMKDYSKVKIKTESQKFINNLSRMKINIKQLAIANGQNNKTEINKHISSIEKEFTEIYNYILTILK